MRRVLHFLRTLARLRGIWLRSPVVWHNVRALWIQSDPEWFSKMRARAEENPMSDEEYEKFMEAIG
jgi:hypothetical protein